MTDLSCNWGEDLGIGPTGDLGLAAGPTQVQQRVLRRLLTNPGYYIWQTEYGAGLSTFVGHTVSRSGLQAIVRSQLLKESAVAPSPEPLIQIAQPEQQQFGRLDVTIEYVNAADSTTSVMSVPISE